MASNEVPKKLASERRKAARSSIILPALVLIDRQEKRARTSNVSVGGVRILVDEPLAISRKIRIGFLAGSRPIGAECRIIHTEKVGPGYLSGLSFTNISQSDLQSLSEYLYTLEPANVVAQAPVVPFPENRPQPSEPENHTEIILPQFGGSTLLVPKGDPEAAGSLNEVNREITSIGRHPDNDIILKDHSVSGHHAKIRFEGDAYFLYDFASTNGTRVNGRRIYRTRIVDGDVIEFGRTAFTFLTKKKAS